MTGKDNNDYFRVNAEAWINDQYNSGKYSYPVAPNRIRIAERILKKEVGNKEMTLLDIGCGDGSLSIALANIFSRIVCLDASEEMLSLARKKVEHASPDIKKKVTFQKGDITKIEINEKFDVIACMGVYEYIDDKDTFFSKIYDYLLPNGLLLMDCRNRLFNLYSISDYTIKELNKGALAKIIEEIREFQNTDIPVDLQRQFLENLNAFSANYRFDSYENGKEVQDIRFKGKIEGDQQTPREISLLALSKGFKTSRFVGVHPHMLIPSINKSLKPQLYNKLCDTLLVFEELPISMIWSSKFIIELRKNEED